MDQDDVGKGIVVIISKNETLKGIVVSVLNEYIFEVENSNGKKSVWNLNNISGFKWKGD